MDNQAHSNHPWWLKPEAIVAALSAVIILLFGIGQFWQHTSDFEVQTKATLARLEAKMDSFALKSEIVEIKTRLDALETRERETNTVLARLKTLIEKMDEEIKELKELNQSLRSLISVRFGDPNFYGRQPAAN